MPHRLSDPARPLGRLDDIARRWQRVAVLRYVADQRRVENPGQGGRPHDFLGIGTGVLVPYAGRPFLVTAHHVMDGARRTPTLYAVVTGRRSLGKRLASGPSQ